MEQGVVLYGASRGPTSSSRVTHFCLMAKDLKVSPTLTPISSYGDDVDNVIIDNVEEDDNIASLKIKGEMIFKALRKNKISCSNFMEISLLPLRARNILRSWKLILRRMRPPLRKWK